MLQRKAGLDNPTMHPAHQQLLIPFAAVLAPAGRQALSSLSLPNLQALLARLQAGPRDAADERSLSPPHENALAHALGWRAADGLWPWAARQAAADGLDSRHGAWGLLTPAHWHLGSQQLNLIDPEALILDASSSRAFFEAVRTLFESQGFVLHWAAPLRWYAVHDSLAGLPCASLDRVIGRNVDAWLGSHPDPHQHPALAAIRRLQAEVQMLLYTHSLNDEREARGWPALNSFWLSGCGAFQADAAMAPHIDNRLRGPALNEDWAAWVKAWDTLDAGPLADLLTASRSGTPVRLILCGERTAQAFGPAPAGLWQGLRGRFSKPAMQPLLEAL